MGVNLVPVRWVSGAVDSFHLLGKIPVKAVAVDGSHANFSSVIVRPKTLNDLVALKIVGDNVLGAAGRTGCSRSMASYFSMVSCTLVRQRGLNLYVRQSHMSQWFVKQICSIPIFASASTISYMVAVESWETSQWT